MSSSSKKALGFLVIGFICVVIGTLIKLPNEQISAPAKADSGTVTNNNSVAHTNAKATARFYVVVKE